MELFIAVTRKSETNLVVTRKITTAAELERNYRVHYDERISKIDDPFCANQRTLQVYLMTILVLNA